MIDWSYMHKEGNTVDNSIGMAIVFMLGYIIFRLELIYQVMKEREEWEHIRQIDED